MTLDALTHRRVDRGPRTLRRLGGGLETGDDHVGRRLRHQRRLGHGHFFVAP